MRRRLVQLATAASVLLGSVASKLSPAPIP